jgi:hypothetical protein
MKQWTRPDGRCFVFGEPDDDLPPGRVYAGANESDAARVEALARLGFAFHRRELVLELPTEAAAWSVPAVETPPPGVAFVRADRFAEERLRELDDLLRQDVPATGPWKWSREGFREETYNSPDFDPATYLVAFDEASEGVGIARIWMRRDGPRLGLIAVRSDRLLARPSNSSERVVSGCGGRSPRTPRPLRPSRSAARRPDLPAFAPGCVGHTRSRAACPAVA